MDLLGRPEVSIPRVGVDEKVWVGILMVVFMISFFFYYPPKQ